MWLLSMTELVTKNYSWDLVTEIVIEFIVTENRSLNW